MRTYLTNLLANLYFSIIIDYRRLQFLHVLNMPNLYNHLNNVTYMKILRFMSILAYFRSIVILLFPRTKYLLVLHSEIGGGVWRGEQAGVLVCVGGAAPAGRVQRRQERRRLRRAAHPRRRPGARRHARTCTWETSSQFSTLSYVTVL